MNKVPMTVTGEQRLRSELDELKSVSRPQVIAAIAEAREHGDLKENAEYHAAREQQGFIEGRIQEIEGKLVLTAGAVSKHVSNVFLKLGFRPEDANRRVKAVLMWLRHTER